MFDMVNYVFLLLSKLVELFRVRWERDEENVVVFEILSKKSRYVGKDFIFEVFFDVVGLIV